MFGLTLSNYLPVKRFYKYMLKRIIGSFLKKDFDLSQLDVSLSTGRIQLTDLQLDVNALNEALAENNLPFQFVEGYIGKIRLDIPWKDLLKQRCRIFVSRVHLVLLSDHYKEAYWEDDPNFPQDGQPAFGHKDLEFNMSRSFKEQADSNQNTSGMEGIATLSRLVSHIVSNMEVFFYDIKTSLYSKKARTLCRATLRSGLLFSEGGLADDPDLVPSTTTQGSGATLTPDRIRCARVNGMRIEVNPRVHPRRDHGGFPYAFIKEAHGGMCLFATDIGLPNSAVVNGVVQQIDIANETIPPISLRISQQSSSSQGSGGVSRAHVDVFIHSIHILLTPKHVAALLALLKWMDPEAATRFVGGDADYNANTAGAAAFSTLGLPGPDGHLMTMAATAMYQSIIDPSTAPAKNAAGQSRTNDFWYELYNLFENDDANDAKQHQETDEEDEIELEGTEDVPGLKKVTET